MTSSDTGTDPYLWGREDSRLTNKERNRREEMERSGIKKRKFGPEIGSEQGICRILKEDEGHEVSHENFDC